LVQPIVVNPPAPLAGEEAEDRKMDAERLSQYSQCKRDGKRKSKVRALPASSADTLPASLRAYP